MKTKNYTVCGDWHLGWGFGPHNHIGKLIKTDVPTEYIWKGHQQGRHGQIWNRPTSIRIRVNDKNIEIIDNPKNRSLPDYGEILKAIEILNPQS